MGNVRPSTSQIGCLYRALSLSSLRVPSYLSIHTLLLYYFKEEEEEGKIHFGFFMTDMYVRKKE
jgi:hypothetical protein